MSNILDRIIAAKRLEVAARKAAVTVEQLQEQLLYNRQPQSLRTALEQSEHYGIIAEFKRKSPSQSDINVSADPALIGAAYETAGAAGMSVLTDEAFFGAQTNPSDISLIRQSVKLPIIRKDFMIDPYQLHEARAMGADAILLIAACLDGPLLDQLAITAKELGLDVICEIHDETELAKISPAVDIVGVNNRNLKDFSVSISQSLRIGEKIPDQFFKISESGLEDAQRIVRLKQEGFGGFLIGTYFMRQPDPGQALAELIHRITTIDNIYQGAIA